MTAQLANCEQSLALREQTEQKCTRRQVVQHRHSGLGSFTGRPTQSRGRGPLVHSVGPNSQSWAQPRVH